MYNYISSIRKTSSIEQCARCFFTKEDIPNLLLTKNNIIEIYDLSKKGLIYNREIEIYGKIVLMLNFPASNEIDDKKKDNIFILTELYDFCVLSYDNESNKIITLFSGTIKEDLGKKQDKILYSLDNDKNFLLISAYKNIFRLICLNTKKRLINNYMDFKIKYQFEDILFLSNFSINQICDEFEIKKDDKSNLLSFAIIKSELIENKTETDKDNSNDKNENNNIKKHQVSLETFNIMVEPKSFNIYYYDKKSELISNKKNIALKVTSSRKSNYNENNNNNKNNNKNNKNININISNTHEKILEHVNLLQKIDITENPTVSLMITHPDGLIVLFFSNYVLYYKYDISKKELNPKDDKKINYTDRKFINYAIIDEKNYKYFVTDEYGNLFILAFIDPFNLKQSNDQFILQILGEINYSTCLTYLDNNYIFNGSNRSNSQLIKIENKNNSLINIVKNYKSLAPIKDMAIINNMKEENGIEILTISGIDKSCSINKIKKGSPVISKGELKIKNIRNVFKIKNINNKKQIYSFIITTITKSFIIDYDLNENIISINKKIDLKKDELILFVENASNYIIIVTTISIKIYDNKLGLITNKPIDERNSKIYPLIIKYNKTLQNLFIYLNNNNLVSYNLDSKGKITNHTNILKDVSICSFDVCKYFMVYSLWESNYLYIYSFNTKEIKNINISSDDQLDYIKISSIQIFKHELIHYIFLSLSNGKLIYFQLKKPAKNYDNLYTFSEEDFIFKRKYNLNFEDFRIKKIKQKNKNSLFINTQTPSFINFNKETPNILYFNIKNCKNLIEIEENMFLFIFNDKILFGSLSNIQSQNIITKFYGKQLNIIKLISFGVSNDTDESNKNNHYILTIEENKINNLFKNSFILNDLNLKEISRYDFEYENEQSNSFTEISLFHGNSIDNKLFVIGTSIIENQSKEATSGHLYLIEINKKNNYSMKKLTEIETHGGVYKVISINNVIYLCIGNILYIYILKQLYDNSYEFQLTKKCSDFTLINDIYIWNQKINEKENNSIDNKDNKKEEENNNNTIIKNENIHYIVISDIYRSIGIYSYDLLGNHLSEICRDYSNAWVYSFSQINNNLLYVSDIEGNIISLKKNNKPIKENDDIKLEKIAYYNYGERINSMIITKIKNKDLYSLSPDYRADNIENNDEIQILFFGTLEGSIGQIIQINKEIFEFLKALKHLLIKNEPNYGGFNYKKWKNYNNGIISKESEGFIDGDIFEKFLNNDEEYKKRILKQLNYSWNKSYHEAIHILEILTNNH